MAENGVSHILTNAGIQKVIWTVFTVLLGTAGFLAKGAYQDITTRIEHNEVFITKIDDKYGVVRDEQIRRRGVLDKVEADIKWLWAESDKVKNDVRMVYELVLKLTKQLDDEVKVTRSSMSERLIVLGGRVDLLETELRVTRGRLDTMSQRILSLAQRLDVINKGGKVQQGEVE
jgi:hypothetical protein